MNRSVLKRLSFTVISLLLNVFAWAQSAGDSASPSIDETMRSHDKIYVVMAVCILILIVFFLYLIRIDRKISKKEKLV